MTQTRLKFRTPEKTIKRQMNDFDRGNLESANLILGDVEKYGGEASGLVVWARMATKRIETERRERL